jgi:hypothetical protein
MNVFVLCTGRCGSATFIEACHFIKNYSSAHESRTSLLGADRFAYPVNHIEADNRLTWVLGRLDAHYGNNAAYVHLTRDTYAVAKSFVARYAGGIIKAYRGKGIVLGLPEDTDPLLVALDYCHTVDTNIKSFLKDKTKTMDFRLEEADRDFPRFCDFIGAEVDMHSALQEFQVRHNATAS